MFNKIFTSKLSILFLCLLFNLSLCARSYVVLITSYNNLKWWRENLESVLDLETIPDKITYRVLYINDCSTDGTGVAIEQYLKDWKLSSGSKLDVTIVHNTLRRGAMSNWYRAIHSCHPDEVIVSLDGDDCLAHKQVLLKLEQAYTQDCWLTYGQYITRAGKKLGENKPLVNNLPVRAQTVMISHLRTFYAGLFQQVPLKDFLDRDDKFYAMACDVAIMLPMLELCSGHYKCLSEVLYIYNNQNPISDLRVNQAKQFEIATQVKNKVAYQPVNNYKVNLNLNNLVLDNLKLNNLNLDSLNNSNITKLNLAPENLSRELQVLQQTGLDILIVLNNTEPVSACTIEPPKNFLVTKGSPVRPVFAKASLGRPEIANPLTPSAVEGSQGMLREQTVNYGKTLIDNCELVSPLDLNNNSLNNIYLTRVKNLVNYSNSFKYIILKHANCFEILDKNKLVNYKFDKLDHLTQSQKFILELGDWISTEKQFSDLGDKLALCVFEPN